MNKIPNGTFIVGNKLMAICPACGNIVRIDKPFLGSLHFCLSDKEVEDNFKLTSTKGERNEN